jgi:uncharacterized protein
MNILVDINHPGQVHLFRNLIRILKDKGHQIIVTIKDIPMGMQLLKLYGIDYINIGKKADSLIGKAFNQLSYDWKVWKLFKKHKIDLAMGSSITIDHASRFHKTKALHFSDDDPDVVPMVVKYAHPFADTILCPDCLSFRKHEKKTVKYSGYHELAYLHPKRFTPDPKILDEVGLNWGDAFFIMRFNAFKAHHDIGATGLSLERKRELIQLLNMKGKIFITTEHDIDPEFSKYKLILSPEKIHSLLYYATMFIGDSQTMTTEAAMLGTPAMKCNSFAGKLSVPNEIEYRYNLCYSYSPEDFDKMVDKIKEILRIPNLKQDWQKRCKRMLSEKIDVTEFIVWFVENYPESAQIMNKNPDHQWNFK